MPVPHRDLQPWWDNPTVWSPPDPTFRRSIPEAAWGGLTAPTADPRTGPNGDIARRGTIPSYVPYAVLNPRHLVTTPQ